MKQIKILFIIALLCRNSSAHNFKETYALIKGQNYFKAKSQYYKNKNNFSIIEQNITEALLLNAFNDPSRSNKIIDHISRLENQIADTIMTELYHVQTDNFIKLYKYREAKNSIQKLLNKYGQSLSIRESDNLKNVLKIWTAFQNEPPQKVKFNSPKPIKLKLDKAELKNLEITTKKDTSYFIFDTGANISTVTMSTARKFKMKIFPDTIEVSTITGKKARAQLAICPVLFLGKSKIQNVIFLVFDDESLYIKEIDYQINGILGFPVIEALGEVKISQNDDFSVTKRKTKEESESNMALNGLTPLILLNGKHYTFDTGADKTILYQAFYLENKPEIEQKYKREKISFSGAGGTQEFEGYVINCDFNINGININLNEIQLLTEKVRPSETVYGNIGQDLIEKFNTMTINFDRMFIKFE